MNKTRLEWDADKDAENQQKHGVSFFLAQYAFADPKRVIAEDLAHSKIENVSFALVRLTVEYSLCVLLIEAE